MHVSYSKEPECITKPSTFTLEYIKVRKLSSGDNPEVKLWKIDGSDQPSDIFTKALPRVLFERHRSKIMGTTMYHG